LLADHLVIDLGDVLDPRILIVASTIERDEDDDNEPKENRDNPRSLPLPQKIKHE
jgi:hypothetical protein